MKRAATYTLAALLLLGAGYGALPIVWKQGGSPLGIPSSINCSTNLTCSLSAGVLTMTATGGGGGGSLNTVQPIVDFGAGVDGTSTVITGQAWVTASSTVLCNPTMEATATRQEGDQDAVIEGLSSAVSNLVPGVGWTLTVWAAKGRAYGQFSYNCIGG